MGRKFDDVTTIQKQPQSTLAELETVSDFNNGAIVETEQNCR
jgi:hypothetical protein